MINQDELKAFLRHQRRKDSAIDQIIQLVGDYETYFNSNYPGRPINQTTIESLESYVSWLESETGESASKPLWAVRYYFDFIENKELGDLAGEMRGERIKRKPFFIRNIRGVNPEYISKLEALYIENIDQVLDEARTPTLRQELSEKSGIPLDGVLEFVKLADLARLRAVRSVRARLYHDAGLTPESIAGWEPDELRTMLVEWVEKTGFDGIAPLPKEVQNLVKQARQLPKIVIY
jgi:hypothetical protein